MDKIHHAPGWIPRPQSFTSDYPKQYSRIQKNAREKNSLIPYAQLTRSSSRSSLLSSFIHALLFFFFFRFFFFLFISKSRQWLLVRSVQHTALQTAVYTSERLEFQDCSRIIHPPCSLIVWWPNLKIRTKLLCTHVCMHIRIGEEREKKKARFFFFFSWKRKKVCASLWPSESQSTLSLLYFFLLSSSIIPARAYVYPENTTKAFYSAREYLKVCVVGILVYKGNNTRARG